MNAEPVIEVVGAIVKDGGKHLVGQRAAHKPQGGLREFTGGKIEPAEDAENDVRRRYGADGGGWGAYSQQKNRKGE